MGVSTQGTPFQCESTAWERGNHSLLVYTCTYLELCNRDFPFAVLAHLRSHGALLVLVVDERVEWKINTTQPAHCSTILALCEVSLQTREPCSHFNCKKKEGGGGGGGGALAHISVLFQTLKHSESPLLISELQSRGSQSWKNHNILLM